MTYSISDYQAYLEKLEKIQEIDWVKNHLYLMKKPNFWTILEYGKEQVKSKERSSHEIRTSRMIRWLLDANGTHNLGNIFAHKLIQLIGGEYHYRPTKNEKIKVIAEYNDIDVFLTDQSQNVYLAIEVKQFAKEGITSGSKSQLDKYEEIVESLRSKNDNIYQPYYIFLTLLKEQPSNKNWHPLGYEELIAIINEVYEEFMISSDDPFIEDTKKIVLDFKDDLQRTVDFLKKDHIEIKSQLSEKDIELTKIFAKEIEEGTDSAHLEKLRVLDNDKDIEIKELIQIIKDYLYAQDHTPNESVRILIRKIHNYLSGGIKLDTDLSTSYTVKQSTAPIKAEIIERYNLEFDKISLTRGKGQGLYLYHKNENYRIYFSGDTHGDFPNHNVQLLEIVKPRNKIIEVSKHLPNNQFIVQEDLIHNNRIKFHNGNEIDLETLIEEHILKAIKELNDLLAVKL